MVNDERPAPSGAVSDAREAVLHSVVYPITRRWNVSDATARIRSVLDHGSLAGDILAAEIEAVAEDVADAILSSPSCRLASDGAKDAEIERLREALERVRDWKPTPYELPSDWSEQIAACPECQRYAGHPIQNGICDTHRRPLWDRERHQKHQEVYRGYAAQQIAADALAPVSKIGGDA